jgi:hypothetical protein
MSRAAVIGVSGRIQLIVLGAIISASDGTVDGQLLTSHRDN